MPCSAEIEPLLDGRDQIVNDPVHVRPLRSDIGGAVRRPPAATLLEVGRCRRRRGLKGTHRRAPGKWAAIAAMPWRNEIGDQRHGHRDVVLGCWHPRASALRAESSRSRHRLLPVPGMLAVQRPRSKSDGAVLERTFQQPVEGVAHGGIGPRRGKLDQHVPRMGCGEGIAASGDVFGAHFQTDARNQFEGGHRVAGQRACAVE